MSPRLPAAVVVASTRAASGARQDTTGALIEAWLERHDFDTAPAVVVADGDPVGVAVAAAVDAGARLVLTTGGTGLTPTDRTPEQTLALARRRGGFEVPGIAEAIRAHGLGNGVGSAMLSRAVAVVVGECLVVNLPGSTGGVRDGLAVLAPVVRHAVEQVVGSDH